MFNMINRFLSVHNFYYHTDLTVCCIHDVTVCIDQVCLHNGPPYAYRPSVYICLHSSDSAVHLFDLSGSYIIIIFWLIFLYNSSRQTYLLYSHITGGSGQYIELTLLIKVQLCKKSTAYRAGSMSRRKYTKLTTDV